MLLLTVNLAVDEMLPSRNGAQRMTNGTNGTSSVANPLPVPPRQFPMFARKAVVQFPKSKPTADAAGEVEADDGHRYYIKNDAHGRPVRASEWLAIHLAEEVGITAPAPMVIELADGSSVFGSRRVAHVSDDIQTMGYLLSPSASNIAPPVLGLTAILSAIYAFDMVIHNDDRHFGNYLSVDDLGSRRMFAFDFSRAVFWQWPWSGFPPPTCNTRKVGAMLRGLHGFDMVSAVATLDRFAAVQSDHVEGLFNRMPHDWIEVSLRLEFTNWWGSSARQARVDELKKGLNDGSAL